MQILDGAEWLPAGQSLQKPSLLQAGDPNSPVVSLQQGVAICAHAFAEHADKSMEPVGHRIAPVPSQSSSDGVDISVAHEKTQGLA